MSYDILETMVCKAFEEAQQSVSFSFQGGEPTLAGLSFFQDFIDLVIKYKKPAIGLHFSIQTNGINLDDKWCDFFQRYNFLVGLSLDGIQKFHDAQRRDIAGNATYNTVVGAYRMLREKDVDVNILCVVTGKTTRLAERTYKGLKDLGCRHLQFIHCLDPVDDIRGGTAHSLLPAQYANFLKTVFDLWYHDWRNDDYCSIRLFDDYVRILAGLAPSSCATSGQCGSYAVIEADGNIYPCDFYVASKWKIGNITEMSFADAFTSPAMAEFKALAHKHPAECATCKWKAICRGGCKRDWVFEEAKTNNYYCQTFKDFFGYAYDRLKIVADAEKAASRR